MSKVMIAMADGLEEVEALAPIDLLRRAGIDIDMVSINGKEKITGSHKIVIETDARLEDISPDDYDGIILPGGMAGTNHLKESKRVCDIVQQFAKEEKLVSAICAAPTVLGAAGVLNGKNATCYPGMEDGLTGAKPQTDEVVKDGNIITSRGMGTAIPFGLAIVAYFNGDGAADALAKQVVFLQ